MSKQNYKKVVKEMCLQRNYNFLSETDDEQLYEECKVIFTGNIKINIQYIKELIHLMEMENIDHTIIVYKGCTTISVKNIIDMTDCFNIELFEEGELNFNITKHSLVPQHIKLCKDNKKDRDILQELKKHERNIPIILRKDPISKFYNYSRGDIIKIKRNDGDIIYRLVY